MLLGQCSVLIETDLYIIQLLTWRSR